MAVVPGIEVLISERQELCRGRRVGVLCHPASVTPDLTHVVDRLIGAGIRPVHLFGPEHGVRGEAQDMVDVSGEVDRRTGIPVTSLYGTTFESLSPPADALGQIDVLLIDLQDIGSRYYTYIWTMALAMQAAAAAKVQIVVLDRPNPLGGIAVEGGDVHPETESFVGLGSIPVRHGLTIGEVAKLVKAGIPWGGDRFARPLDCDLEIVPMRGWRRQDSFEATGLPWVLPSPNMPTVDTAFVYPGQCLLEGTNVSEGRGSTRPFEIIGAPFIDGHRLAERLHRHDLPGIRFRPLSFRPTFQKHAGKSCGGVQLHVVDRTTFQPYRTGIALLRELWAVGGEAFGWRTEAYEFVAHRPAIDLLTGGDEVRLGIERGAPLEEIFASFVPAERAFRERRRAHLIYE
ncbi:MAG TPA: DUF1343 domain-containing protein [Polyangia bacterium]